MRPAPPPSPSSGRPKNSAPPATRGIITHLLTTICPENRQKPRSTRKHCAVRYQKVRNLWITHADSWLFPAFSGLEPLRPGAGRWAGKQATRAAGEDKPGKFGKFGKFGAGWGILQEMAGDEHRRRDLAFCFSGSPALLVLGRGPGNESGRGGWRFAFLAAWLFAGWTVARRAWARG